MRDRCLSDFEGRWRLEKDIRQQHGGSASFEGEAVWDTGGRYSEQGQLTLEDGTRIRAERRYVWQVPLAVFFEDGRFFHDVPPCGGEAHHDCPPDQYRVAYDFGDWPRWQAVWRVTGPRKAYEMICRYSPLSD